MKVYFAHPCFTAEQENFKTEFLAKLYEILGRSEEGRSIAIVDPFVFSPTVEGDTDEKLRLCGEIATTCLRLLEESDVLIALVDGDDTGVAFEAGYAHCLNIPVFLVSGARCDRANAMLLGAAKERFDFVLEEDGMEGLARLLTWYRLTLKNRPASPGHN